MLIRKQTLEEWFLCYQLRSLKKRHFHLPIDVDIDVTELVRQETKPGEKPPYTAILVKTVAEAAKMNPNINKTLFRTLFGARIVEFDRIHINMPIVYKFKGRKHLGAVVIKDADKKSIQEINAEILKEMRKPLRERPVGRLVVDRKNHFLNRLSLKLVHFLVYNFPSFYVRKGGGGISVSSLLNLAEEGFHCRPVSFGNTAYTFCCSEVDITDSGRHILKVGAGCDHYAAGGMELISALKTLTKVNASFRA